MVVQARDSRPDASMALLTTLVENPVDDDYAARAALRAQGPDGPRRPRWLLLAGLLAVGLMFALSILQVQRNADAVSSERAALRERVQQQTAAYDANLARVEELRTEVEALQSSLLVGEDGGLAAQLRLDRLGAVTGADAVTGPGVRVVVDDAPPDDTGTTPTVGQVLDIDVQRLLNGIWAAGAEAVSIGGQRVTSLTAVRSANDVILVNYRPITRPYEILAIGDTRTLPADILDGPGGRWFQTIATAHGVRFDISTDEELTLPAASLVLRYATPVTEAP